jgi:SAM-dependent methyltransferase
VSPDESEGGLPDDVVAISVASYSGDPGAFAVYGANAVAGPFGRFAALLPPNAIVLDASCGPGRDLARLHGLGHMGVGVDLNEDFVRRARKEGLTIHGDLRSLPVLSGSFDAVWASASLIHLPFDDAGVALGELARVAKVGAPLGISVKTGGITGWADDLPLGRRWFYNWAPDDLTGLVENIGLSVEAVSDDGLWIEVVARR